MFFVFLGGGLFFGNLRFFFPFTIDVLLKYIYIFFLSESQFMSVVKIRQRSLPEAHVKKKINLTYLNFI